MKLIVAFLFALTSSQVFADYTFNDICRTIYGDGTEKMIDAIESFNSHEISELDLSLISADVSTEMSTFRMTCALVEDPENKEAVLKYKKLYKEVRGKVKALALIVGTQKSVDMSFIDISLTKAKLKILDLKFDR